MASAGTGGVNNESLAKTMETKTADTVPIAGSTADTETESVRPTAAPAGAEESGAGAGQAGETGAPPRRQTAGPFRSCSTGIPDEELRPGGYPGCGLRRGEYTAHICTPRYGRAVLLTQDKHTVEETLQLRRIKDLWQCRASPNINTGGLDGCAYFLQRTDFVRC